MPKLIVKPAINFLSTVTDVQLEADVSHIIRQMTDNESFPDPSPSLAIVGSKLHDFRFALREAWFGGKLLTLEKNMRRAELVAVVRQLAGYVTARCSGDLVTLMSSGFPFHKPTRHAVGALTPPDMPRLKHKTLSGCIDAVVSPVRGASIYTWQLALASAPKVVLQTVHTTAARASFADLMPGQVYTVRVNAIGTAGPTNFSNPATLMSL